jgi:hypothetical protein
LFLTVESFLITMNYCELLWITLNFSELLWIIWIIDKKVTFPVVNSYIYNKGLTSSKIAPEISWSWFSLNDSNATIDLDNNWSTHDIIKQGRKHSYTEQFTSKITVKTALHISGKIEVYALKLIRISNKKMLHNWLLNNLQKSDICKKLYF